ncbi:MAG: GNAT family N-acetyltransferase [Planctomycetota bacterium]
MAPGEPVAFRVRPARQEDAAAIARVHVATWDSAYRGLIADAVIERFDLATRTSRWEGALRESLAATHVAELRDEVVAFVSEGPARDDDLDARTGEVWALYADRSVWGTGVGRALVEYAFDRLRERGAERCVVWVLEENRRARDFYERVGFVPDGTTREGPAGVAGPLRDLRLARPL